MLFLVNKHCKHFRHEPYMTPNNYDLYFNPNEIPANIKRENAPNLVNRLQKLMPLSKILHVNFNTNPESITESNTISINTNVIINRKEVEFI